MNIVTIVGARPQFIKAAALSRELRKRHREYLVHTGQHYDYDMSGVFFDRLRIPAPDINLEVGSGGHGKQTGAMLEGIEIVLMREKPDWVLVYGDTNSTLAGALAASKLHIPVAHVEAGLRSFNRRMPEEINRVVADHISSLLLCPSPLAADNLAREGVKGHVALVGDVMSDVLLWAKEQVEISPPAMVQDLGVSRGGYYLATMHRAENTDDPVRLNAIVGAFNALNQPVLFPAHPRTRKVMEASGSSLKPHVRLMEPVGYFEMVALTKDARMVLTDSGGLQKEAYWLGVPCVTLRDETEWLETVEAGGNVLAGADPAKILEAANTLQLPAQRKPLYGEGGVAARCVTELEKATSEGLR